MRPNFINICCAVIMGLALAPGFADARSYPPVVIFGDSISDTGNRFLDEGVVNTPPYDLAAAEDLIPSAPYAIGGQTFTNGAVWVERFAKALGHPAASQPALRSNGVAANYAYAGARASNAPPVEPNSNQNLTDQVLRYLADVNNDIAGDTLHVVFVGGADVGEAIRLLQSPGAPEQVIANAVGSMVENVLSRLYANGARRFFLVTAPNTGYIPAFAAVRELAVFYGAQLATAYNCAIAGVSDSRPVCPPPPPGLPAPLTQVLAAAGAEVHVLDGQGLFDLIVNNKQDFGLKNELQPCIQPFEPPFRCEMPSEYVYWDNIHPTARVHEIVGDAAIQVMNP